MRHTCYDSLAVNVFSTCWNSKRHKDGGAMCDEIRELGFDTIEASHGLSLAMLPGVIKAVEEGRIKVAGVHNFCPAPMEVAGDAPDAYQFTSYRQEERERAMRLTKETLQVAARLGAAYVVLHMGSVHPFLRVQATRKLQRMARHGALGTEAYAAAKRRYVEQRYKLSPLYDARVRKALAELSAEAAKLNLILAVESRSHLEQMPGETEMYRLMEDFKDDPHVMYWHDFGHVQRKHNLLLLNHDQYLRRLKPYIYGAHINDVQWPQRDHRAPFFGGDVDFRTLVPRYFYRECPLTWELSPSVRREDILEAKQLWDEMMQTVPERYCRRCRLHTPAPFETEE